MDPIDYYKSALLEKYLDFTGRARRAEFWYFYLIHFLILFGLVFTAFIITPRIYIPIMVGYALFSAIPCLAVTVRRLHDIGKSGWWVFIKFIPVIGPIILLVYLATEGTYGPNYYGEDPIEEGYELE